MTEKVYSRIYEEASTSIDPHWLEEKTNTVLSQLVEKILAGLELLAALK